MSASETFDVAWNSQGNAELLKRHDDARDSIFFQEGRDPVFPTKSTISTVNTTPPLTPRPFLPFEYNRNNMGMGTGKVAYRFPFYDSWPKTLPGCVPVWRPNCPDSLLDYKMFCPIDGLKVPNLSTFAKYFSFEGFTPNDEVRDVELMHNHQNARLFKGGDRVVVHRIKTLDKYRYFTGQRLFLDIPRDKEEYDEARKYFMNVNRGNPFVPLLVKSHTYCYKKYSKSPEIIHDIEIGNARFARGLVASGKQFQNAHGHTMEWAYLSYG